MTRKIGCTSGLTISLKSGGIECRVLFRRKSYHRGGLHTLVKANRPRTAASS
jgi:hypothetical protein